MYNQVERSREKRKFWGGLQKLSEELMPDEETKSPWVGEVPELSVYDWRGYRMLATASWKLLEIYSPAD